jgi:hypothetical protein
VEGKMREEQSKFRKKPGPVESELKQPIQPEKKNLKLVINPVVVGTEYVIDQLEIVSKVAPALLSAEIKTKLRPISRELVLYSAILDLKKEKAKRNKDTKRKQYKEAYKQGFRSIFRMTRPTVEFFDILLKMNLFSEFISPGSLSYARN